VPLDELRRGLWRWTARHPEWHPAGGFGAEVASFALHDGGDTVLIDPLLDDDDPEVLEQLDALTTGSLRILITIPYHARSAESLWARNRDTHDASIWGHPAVAKRLAPTTPLNAIAPGAQLPGGVTAHAIGKPRRFELPLYLPSRRALAFGDALVEVGGELRVWIQKPLTAQRLTWYRERLLPTLLPLADLDVDEVLVTHGEPVLGGGRRALAAALRADPWYHAPS
jgi:hypothetical protein